MDFDNTWNALLRPGESEFYFRAECLKEIWPPAFETKASEYTPVNGWWLAEICRLIYRRGEDEMGPCAHPVTRGHILSTVSMREYCFLNRNGVQCAIIMAGEETDHPFAVLVFRGTNSFESWLSNLNAIQTPWDEGGMVHAGFKNEFCKIWPELDEALSEISCPIFYTGHSLGGALATLAASKRPPQAVYTFGSPRVGDPVFAESLRPVSIYRIANNSDIVTGLPPSRIPFDFCHVGQSYRFSADNGHNNPPHNNATGWSFVKGNGNWADAPAFWKRRLMGPPDFLAGHAPVNYSAYLVKEIISGHKGIIQNKNTCHTGR